MEDTVSHLCADDFIVFNSNVRHEYHTKESVLIGSIFFAYGKVSELFNGQPVYLLCDSTIEETEAYKRIRSLIRRIFHFYQTNEGQGNLLRESAAYELMYILTSDFIVHKGMENTTLCGDFPMSG